MFLKPTYLIAGDVTDIDLDQLWSDGIRALILDLDSTIMAPKAGVLTPETASWLAQAQTRFKLAVLSNNKRDDYLEQCKKCLDMPIIFRGAKPSRKGFFDLMALFELKPEEIAVVGDRPLTDVWGGHRASMKTVLVYPLKSIVEPSWKTTLRRMERIFIRP